MTDIITQYSQDEIADILKAYQAKAFKMRNRGGDCKEAIKMWYEKHPTYRGEYNKDYYEKHRGDKVKCDCCNVEVSRYAYNRHRLSKRHLTKTGFTLTAECLNRTAVIAQ